MPSLKSLVPQKFRSKDKTASASIQHANSDNGQTAETDSVQAPKEQEQSPPQITPRTDKYGLFPFHAEGDTNYQAVEASSNATITSTWPIDIVALHGITGDAYKTWEHENGTLWLRDLLQPDFPGSRVFSYGYDADVFFSLGTGDLETFARTMLQSVKQSRVEMVVTSSTIIWRLNLTDDLKAKPASDLRMSQHGRPCSKEGRLDLVSFKA